MNATRAITEQHTTRASHFRSGPADIGRRYRTRRRTAQIVRGPPAAGPMHAGAGPGARGAVAGRRRAARRSRCRRARARAPPSAAWPVVPGGSAPWVRSTGTFAVATSVAVGARRAAHDRVVRIAPVSGPVPRAGSRRRPAEPARSNAAPRAWGERAGLACARRSRRAASRHKNTTRHACGRTPQRNTTQTHQGGNYIPTPAGPNGTRGRARPPGRVAL